MASITTTTSTTSANSQLQQLVSSLMTNDRKPLVALQTQQSTLQSRLTVYQGLATKLSGLVTLARTFGAYGSTNPLLSMSVSGNDTSVLEATATAGTTTGVYTIEIQQLATRQTLTSSEVTGSDTAGSSTKAEALAQGSGNTASGDSTASFRIQAGGKTTTVNVPITSGATKAQAMSLLAGAINQAGAGVTATVLDVGQGKKRLQIQAASAGSSAQVTEITDLQGTWMSDLGLATGTGNGKSGPKTGTGLSGTQARFLINGIEVTAESNVIKDVIPGLTLTLHSLGTQTITVARDEDAEVKQVESFISNYNSVLDEVRKQTQAADSTTGQARGALAGDTSFSRLRSGIRDAATRPVTGLSDSLNQLTEIGLTVDQQGHLSDGDGKSLRAALESSPEGVDALFRGVSGRLVTLLNAYSRAGGILAQDEQSIQTQMRHLTSRISDTNKTLTARQTTLMNQMAQLSSTVDLLNTQKQWLDSLYGTTSSSSS